MNSKLHYKDIHDESLEQISIHRFPEPLSDSEVDSILRSRGNNEPTEQHRTDYRNSIKNANKWSWEVWDIYKGSEHVYHKGRTIANCWDKYGFLDVPSGYLWSGDNEYYKMLKIPPGTPSNEYIVPTLESYEGLDKLRFFKRIYRDTPETRQLFKAIKDFYKDFIPEKQGAFQSLFGEPNDFSAHWNWSGALQKLYGNERGWVFNIAHKRGLPDGDYAWTATFDCTAMLANTNITDVTFKFNNYSVMNMTSMFSSVRTDTWGTFNVNVEHVGERPKYGVKVNSSNEIERVSCFMPLAITKCFRSAQPSQQALDNVMKNTNWQRCKEFIGAFQSGLRCQHSYIHQNMDCEPYEEHPANTWKPNYTYGWTDTNFGIQDHTYVYGLKDTFNDSCIDDVRVVIDFDYLFSPNQHECAHIGFLRADRNLRWGQGLNAEGVKPMRRIRIKNLGNDPLYDFAGGHGQGCDGHYFDEASIKYLIDNLKDLNGYSDVQEVRNVNKVMQRSAELYVPEQWREHITPEQLAEMTRKRWKCYIGEELLNPETPENVNVDITHDANRSRIE